MDEPKKDLIDVLLENISKSSKNKKTDSITINGLCPKLYIVTLF